MAEADVRRRSDSGFNNRKRRFREDDEYDRRPPRRRYEEPPVAKLRRQLLDIADSGRSPEDDVSDIARIVCDNVDDEDFRSSFLDLAVKLVVEQPFRIPFVAAVIKVVNRQKPDLTKKALSRFGARAQEYLNDGIWRELKLVLRLFACSQEIFEDDGVFPILEELFNRAVDLQTASSEDSVGLEIVKVILLTIPYLLTCPDTGLEERAMALLDKTDVIASTPHPFEELVETYPAVGGDTSAETQSVISLLQKQLQEEASRGWKLACIPRISFAAPATNGSTDDSTNPRKHTLPMITVPQPVSPGPKALFPEMFFSLYADQDVETVPSTSGIAGSLLRDTLVDTMNLLDFSRVKVAKFLVDIDSFWTAGTFVKRGIPFDRLKEAAGDGSTWKPEDMAVDAVFSQILQLPMPEHKVVYYHSLITEACKAAPAAIAPSLGRAIRYLFQRVDLMDMELFYRFMDWFAHHLSNFDFRWKWTEWLNEATLSDLHPKKAFIVGVIDKEIRLSFARRIRETLPEPYHILVPKAKDEDIPKFKYNSDTTPFSQEGQEMVALIRNKKATDDEIQVVINKIHEKAAELDVKDVHLYSTDAYVTSICHVGSKSISHFLSVIDRCKEWLHRIGLISANADKQIITSVVEYWKDHTGVAVNILDKLLNYTIISPKSVVEWALVDHLNAGRILSETYVYELVRTTVRKVTTRVRQIVTARLQPGLLEEQIVTLDATVVEERNAMRSLFRLIEDSLSGVAQGANDEMIENGYGDADEGKEEEGAMLKAWGEKWLRVFRRESAVVETAVSEESVAAALETMAATAAREALEGNAGEGTNGDAAAAVREDEEMEQDVAPLASEDIIS